MPVCCRRRVWEINPYRNYSSVEIILKILVSSGNNLKPQVTVFRQHWNTARCVLDKKIFGCFHFIFRRFHFIFRHSHFGVQGVNIYLCIHKMERKKVEQETVGLSNAWHEAGRARGVPQVLLPQPHLLTQPQQPLGWSSTFQQRTFLWGGGESQWGLLTASPHVVTGLTPSHKIRASLEKPIRSSSPLPHPPPCVCAVVRL